MQCMLISTLALEKLGTDCFVTIMMKTKCKRTYVHRDTEFDRNTSQILNYHFK